MLELCQPRHCFFKSVPKRLDVGFQNVNQWIRAAVEVVEKRSKPQALWSTRAFPNHPLADCVLLTTEYAKKRLVFVGLPR